MAKAPKRPASKKPAKKVHDAIELEVGIFPCPVPIDAPELESAEYELLMAAFVDGPLLGTEIDVQGNLQARAGAIVRDWLKSDDLPYLPGTLRVADDNLAALLRPEITTRIELICGPTPSLDEAMRLMQAELNRKFTYLDAEASRVASYFKAAAQMFRAKPWKFIPAESLVSLTIGGIEVYDLLVSVKGDHDEEPGFFACSDLDEVEQFVEAAERREAGEDFEFPSTLFQLYQHMNDVRPDLRGEIESHGWEVAGPAAWPWLASLEADGTPLPPVESDIVLAELICLSLTELAKHPRQMKEAWRDAEQFELTETFQVGEDKLEVVIRFPVLEDEFDDLLGLDGLDDDGDEEGAGEIDPADFERLEKELLEHLRRRLPESGTPPRTSKGPRIPLPFVPGEAVVREEKEEDEPPSEGRHRSPGPAERKKTGHAGPQRGSTRRKR